LKKKKDELCGWMDGYSNKTRAAGQGIRDILSENKDEYSKYW